MKRALSLSFLLFANIFVLVHPVVPHHYHKNTGVCFSLHCQDSKEAHRHEHQDSPIHQHEGNPLSDECSFEVVFATAYSKIKIACRIPVTDFGHTLFTNNIDKFDFVAKTTIVFRQNFYLILFYPDYISQSLGLRAPPIS